MVNRKLFIICCCCCCCIAITLGLLQDSLLEKNLDQELALSNVIKEFSRNLNLLLEIIKLEKDFQCIVLLKTPHKDCIFDEVIKDFPLSLYIWPENLDNLENMLKYNKETIVVSCQLDLALENYHLHSVPHVLYIQPDERADIEETCDNIYFDGERSKIIMISEEFLQNPVFIHCGIYLNHVSYNLSQFKSDKSIRIFQKLFRGVFNTESNLLPPFNILYEDEDGTIHLEGYVGNCVKTYAKKHSTSLVILGTPNVIHYKDFKKYIGDGFADITAVVVPLQHKGLSENFSYPLQFMEECFMIPMPTVKPINKLFFNIIGMEVLLIIPLLAIVYAVFLSIGQYNSFRNLSFTDVIFSDKSIRGLLGQSFVLPLKTSLFTRYCYVLIFFTNIMLMTFYNAFMQSNLIAPPLEKTIKNMADIRKAGLKIAVHPRDLEDWHYDFYKDYQDIIYNMTSSYANFTSLRDSLNTSYVYPVAYPIWTIYEEQQKFFQRKLFFYSRNLCVTNATLVSLPIRYDFSDVEGFNQHLLDVQAAGLLKHWLSQVFTTLVRLKQMSFKDLSTPNTYDGFIHWHELYWIWCAFLGCIMVSLVVFAGELLVYRMRKCCKRTKSDLNLKI